MKTMILTGYDAPGHNRGAVWNVRETCRVRGYDMEGVEICVPSGYRVRRFTDGFEVVSPIWHVWQKLRGLFAPKA